MPNNYQNLFEFVEFANLILTEKKEKGRMRHMWAEMGLPKIRIIIMEVSYVFI